MSYDLEVRADAEYSRSVPLGHIGSFIASLPGITRTGPASFVVDRVDSGIYLNIDLYQQHGEDSPRADGDPVTGAALMVAYPLLGRTAPVAVEVAFRIAERLGWSVYDPQAECDLTRESAGAIGQAPAGPGEDDILARTAAAGPSLGALFGQEMWNHSLPAATALFVAAAATAIALLFHWERPRADFDRYMPWAVAVGGLAALWMKAFAQALVRWRRLRRAPRS